MHRAVQPQAGGWAQAGGQGRRDSRNEGAGSRAEVTQPAPAEFGFEFRDTEENVTLMTRIPPGGKFVLLLNPKSYPYLLDPFALWPVQCPAASRVGLRFLPARVSDVPAGGMIKLDLNGHVQQGFFFFSSVLYLLFVKKYIQVTSVLGLFCC